jgi:hypothetical protein
LWIENAGRLESTVISRGCGTFSMSGRKTGVSEGWKFANRKTEEFLLGN